MRSWESAVSSVVAAVARSTWGSPSTARRTDMPWSCRRWSSMPSPSDGKEGGLLGALQADVEAQPVVPVGDGDQPGPDLRVGDRGQQGVGGVGGGAGGGGGGGARAGR